MLDGGIIGEIVVEEKSRSREFGDREKWGEDGGGVGWYVGASVLPTVPLCCWSPWCQGCCGRCLLTCFKISRLHTNVIPLVKFNVWKF